MSENSKETKFLLLCTSNDDFMMILIDLIIFCHGKKDWKILSLVEGLGNPFTSEGIFQFHFLSRLKELESPLTSGRIGQSFH